jgi:hypothetical protein
MPFSLVTVGHDSFLDRGRGGVHEIGAEALETDEIRERGDAVRRVITVVESDRSETMTCPMKPPVWHEKLGSPPILPDRMVSTPSYSKAVAGDGDLAPGGPPRRRHPGARRRFAPCRGRAACPVPGPSWRPPGSRLPWPGIGPTCGRPCCLAVRTLRAGAREAIKACPTPGSAQNSLSDTTICKRAKANGWTRDLSGAVRSRVGEEVRTLRTCRDSAFRGRHLCRLLPCKWRWIADIATRDALGGAGSCGIYQCRRCKTLSKGRPGWAKPKGSARPTRICTMSRVPS